MAGGTDGLEACIGEEYGNSGNKDITKHKHNTNNSSSDLTSNTRYNKVADIFSI